MYTTSVQDMVIGHLHKAADRLRQVSQGNDISTRGSVDVLIAINYILDSIEMLSAADGQQDCISGLQ